MDQPRIILGLELEKFVLIKNLALQLSGWSKDKEGKPESPTILTGSIKSTLYKSVNDYYDH